MSGVAVSASAWPLSGRTGTTMPPATGLAASRRRRPARPSVRGSDRHRSATPRTRPPARSSASTAQCSIRRPPAARKAARNAAITRRGSTWWSSAQNRPAATEGRSAGSSVRTSAPPSQRVASPQRTVQFVAEPQPLDLVAAERHDQRAAVAEIDGATGLRLERAAECGHMALAFQRQREQSCRSPGSCSAAAASMPVAARLAPAPTPARSNTATRQPAQRQSPSQWTGRSRRRRSRRHRRRPEPSRRGSRPPAAGVASVAGACRRGHGGGTMPQTPLAIRNLPVGSRFPLTQGWARSPIPTPVRTGSGSKDFRAAGLPAGQRFLSPLSGISLGTCCKLAPAPQRVKRQRAIGRAVWAAHHGDHASCCTAASIPRGM